MEKKRTVIYIVSDRRSGSTLLENILSKSAEVTSVGELNTLRGHILKQGPGERWNWNCACGRPVTECEFWAPVLKNTYQADPSTFNTNIDWNYKSRKLYLVSFFPTLFRKALKRIVSSRKNRDVAGTLNRIYERIFEQTGKTFIVDSSKDPLQSLSVYLGKRDYDVKIIWLKRDLRAIAVSKSKWKVLNVKKQKGLKKMLMDVFYYRRICYAASLFFAREDLLKIHYEDLAQRTQEQLDRIAVKFGLNAYTAPEYMYVEEDHTIGGTPNRFEKRPIRYEEGWKKNFEHKKMLYIAGEVLNKL